MLLVKIEGDVYLTFTEFHSEIWIPKNPSPINYWILERDRQCYNEII